MRQTNLFLVTATRVKRNSTYIVDGETLAKLLAIFKKDQPNWDRWRGLNGSLYLGDVFDWIKGTHRVQISPLFLNHDTIPTKPVKHWENLAMSTPESRIAFALQEIIRLKVIINEIELEYESACVHDDSVKIKECLRDRNKAFDLIEAHKHLIEADVLLIKQREGNSNDASS